jgi:hypothetical protein
VDAQTGYILPFQTLTHASAAETPKGISTLVPNIFFV